MLSLCTTTAALGRSLALRSRTRALSSLVSARSPLPHEITQDHPEQQQQQGMSASARVADPTAGVHQKSHNVDDEVQQNNNDNDSNKRCEQSVLIDNIRSQFLNYGQGCVELQTDDQTGLATIRLSNPNRKNSLSGKMMAQMTQVIEELHRWKMGKAVIVEGEEGFFCSGGDLNTVRQICTREDGRRMSQLMQHNFTRLNALPFLSVALIQGMALGGGAEMLTACDFRVMSRSARIGFVQIRIGITAAWGGGARLAQLVGTQKAMDLLLSGRTVGAEEALAMGLIDCIVEEQSATEESLQFIHKYCRHSVECIHATKQLLNGARHLPLQLALRDELEWSASVWGGRAHREALNENVKHREREMSENSSLLQTIK